MSNSKVVGVNSNVGSIGEDIDAELAQELSTAVKSPNNYINISVVMSDGSKMPLGGIRLNANDYNSQTNKSRAKVAKSAASVLASTGEVQTFKLEGTVYFGVSESDATDVEFA